MKAAIVVLALSIFGDATAHIDYALNLEAVYQMQSVLERIDKAIPAEETADE